MDIKSIANEDDLQEIAKFGAFGNWESFESALLIPSGLGKQHYGFGNMSLGCVICFRKIILILFSLSVPSDRPSLPGLCPHRPIYHHNTKSQNFIKN
jgi:hypothetical protein